MKKIIKTIIFMTIFAFTFSFAKISFAQTTQTQPQAEVKTVLVASVNIYNPSSKKINGATYSISFRIQNNKGVQSNIRYGIQLVKKSDRKVADLLLANESLTLGEGEFKDITMQYSIPNFIEEGEYRMLIVAQNQNGLVLAVMPTEFPEKTITIENNSGLSMDKCFLKVEGNEKQYNTVQGVDIKPEEKLVATCTVSNKSIKEVKDYKLQLITHKRDQFGDILANDVLDQKISLKPRAEQVISFSIPVIKTPQAYDVDTFAINNNGEKVSQSVYLHYVVHGSSATIQNTTLDKKDYKKGNTAELKVFWTPAADSFSDSRLGGTKDSFSIEAKITDFASNICGEGTKKVSRPSTLGDDILKITINKDCPNAIASVNIKNEKGEILDSTKININEPTSNININANIPFSVGTLNSINRIYVAIFIVVLVLIGYGVIALRKKDK